MVAISNPGRQAKWHRRLLCKIGIHDWSCREVHIVKKVTAGATEVQTSALEVCDCGESRAARGGWYDKPTQFFVPDKYRSTASEYSVTAGNAGSNRQTDEIL